MKIISGKYKGMPLKAPKGLQTRPTSSILREAVFNMIQFEVEGSTFRDLFAGSGAMGLEALSRGAAFAVFIDISRDACKAINENIKKIDVQKKCYVIQGEAFIELKRMQTSSRKYDFIYIDPPYDSPLTSKILLEIDNSQLLTEKGIVFLEESQDFSVPDLRNIQHIKNKKIGRSMLYTFKTRVV